MVGRSVVWGVFHISYLGGVSGDGNEGCVKVGGGSLFADFFFYYIKLHNCERPNIRLWTNLNVKGYSFHMIQKMTSK